MNQQRRPRSKRKKRPPVIYHTPGRECSHADSGCCPSCMTGRPRVTLFGKADRLIVTRQYIVDSPIQGRSVDLITVDEVVAL